VRPFATPAFSTIFWDTSEVALATVRQLLDLKEASVLDVDPEGATLLWVSDLLNVSRLRVQGNAIKTNAPIARCW
jgi:hypothetical protein